MIRNDSRQEYNNIIRGNMPVYVEICIFKMRGFIGQSYPLASILPKYPITIVTFLSLQRECNRE